MRTADVIIVGAGIIGLAHAYGATQRGLSVTVIEENAGTVGASIRNFGHCCITGQSGEFADLAESGREHWLTAASGAGFWAAEAGGYVLAQNQQEIAVLEEAQKNKGTERIQLLDRDEIARAVGTSKTTAVGGAHLPLDLRVDPREAAPALAAWLKEHRAVEFLYRTRVLTVEDGEVLTTRGSFTAGHVIVCAGHLLPGLFPGLAEDAQMRECSLAMTLATAPDHFTANSAMLSGTSLLRYDAFSETQAAEDLRAHMQEHAPGLVDISANVMFTRRPDGTVIIGDSHHYATSVEPFVREETSRLLLKEAAGLLGVDSLNIRERWQGVYASSPVRPLIVEELDSKTTAITVATGIGMTISFGLADRTLTQLQAHSKAA
ncbi:TIGR03364 family FAD-dependent oxidoreductase [Brevibacterium ravenspurgense]|uniref:TIGR03364 family FAD-dependent oxidoreductase n=1 Tax=Brevibacterium ravenspurgense TaxID=479117 RepID=UPI001C60D6E7|nr:TIGR03364 family FAD-dependent oxidoreductase [Brevibacterium ravenspurgense]